MRSTYLLAVPVVLAFCAAVAACGRSGEPQSQPGAQPSAAESSATAPESSAAAAAPAPQKFDVANVPLSNATLPPFPYLDWLEAVPEKDRKPSRTKNFDSITVIAGKQLVEVEGRLETRDFNIPESMSQIEVRRNYESRIRELGGVKVNEINPVNAKNATITEEVQALAGADANVAEILGLKSYDEGKYEYEVYVIRTADTTAWIVVQTSQFSVIVTTVAQQAMQQSLALVSADAMKKALDEVGHIALYVNFDTDAATLRPDAAPVIAEITRLLQTHAALALSIEGHTDNTGTAARNQVLSRERAAAVVSALVAAGIDAARLSAVGHGQDKPIADNATEPGRAQNRRVELVKR